MIWAAILSLMMSFPASGEDEERALEAGEVMQEGCLQGTCFRMVNTTPLTQNRAALAKEAEVIMETREPLKSSDSGKSKTEK